MTSPKCTGRWCLFQQKDGVRILTDVEALAMGHEIPGQVYDTPLVPVLPTESELAFFSYKERRDAEERDIRWRFPW